MTEPLDLIKNHRAEVEDIKATSSQGAEIRELEAKAARLRDEMLKSRRG